MNDDSREEIEQIETAIKDLDLDYMRGWISEEEYNQKISDLKSQLEAAGGTPAAALAPAIKPSDLASASLQPPPTDKKAMIDPVSAVKRTVQSMRKIGIERIAQESGVPAHEVSKILSNLLDGRELSGRVDHDSGDFILGTGSGPAPKTVHGCPYCRAEINRVAVKGETITCNVCRQSFIIS
ncbi:MAG: PCI domain-containing protein [Candidatus Thorarchaeota archaeon]|nr:PCI domain-containing protein [Candidatus Thorarchaeota archaeon]MCK5240406.1 PCI domain-containing protein [Candidatus Thorarchaeota archaeon]